MPPVISVEHLSKTYRLGQIGTPSRASALAGRAAGTFVNDLKLWWAKVRVKHMFPDTV